MCKPHGAQFAIIPFLFSLIGHCLEIYDMMTGWQQQYKYDEF
jgi:hypothetical protein